MTVSFATKILSAAKTLLLGTVVAGVTSASVVAAPEFVASGKLSVGSDLTYPPFAYMKDGKPAGFDVEFMEALAKQMELETAFVDTRFASLITGLRANQFDVVTSALYVTPERQKVVDFVPYIYAGSSILVLSDAEYKPTKVEELCGKNVGSIKGASWIPNLLKVSKDYCVPNNLGEITSLEFDTDAATTQALRSRAVDAQFMDNMVGLEVIERFPADYQITSTELLYPIMVGVAVNPQNKALLTAVAEGFAALRASGDYQKLVSKYKLQAVADEDIASFVKAAQ
jgi:polar amino acid transport system substrate-binding protein